MLVLDDSAKGDIDIGRYYAARGKLVGVDEEHEGHTAPVSAPCRGELDIVYAQLAEGPGVDKTYNRGGTVLIPVSGRGHIEEAKALLAAGA